MSNSFKQFLYGTAIFSLALTAQVEAQTVRTDSSAKLIASLNRKTETFYTIQEPNIVFPDILKGNEEQSIDYIQSFSNRRRDYLIRMFNKGKQFLPKAANILKKYDVPQEFKILLVLESAFNADALSKAGAVGYWQIMDEVAKEYGLKYVDQKEIRSGNEPMVKETVKIVTKRHRHITKVVSKPKDERKNFIKSTTVAARYLKDRKRNLNNNYLLMVASYNCGVGNVWDAMEKSGKANPTFWDIKKYLPQETQSYVMNFITLNVIFNNYNKFTSNTLTYTPVKIPVKDNFEQNMSDAMSETSGSF